VRELGIPYIHAKAIVVDGARAYVGSENLSTQSLDRNREVGILENGSIASTIQRVFEGDWKQAKSIRR
jgi:phosphatidylserine/phosphatidylglycerophosphate/cardiolipin synthase-like enzyme